MTFLLSCCSLASCTVLFRAGTDINELFSPRAGMPIPLLVLTLLVTSWGEGDAFVVIVVYRTGTLTVVLLVE